MTNTIADDGLTGHAWCLPRYRYIPAEVLTQSPDTNNLDLERVSNINPVAVAEFQAHYSDESITDDDLFYYTYGVLHSEQYRQTFADDLSKSAARIPMAASLGDFRAFVEAGVALADLHVGYESVEPYPLKRNTRWVEPGRARRLSGGEDGLPPAR